MNIVFIRHGSIEANKNDCYIGVLDCQLSLDGIQEMKKVKNLLKGIYFDAVYSSPMKRAIHSTKVLRKKFIIDERLKEMNFGIFEGLSYDEIIKKYPDELAKWNQDYVNYIIPNGECLMDVAMRINSFMEDVSKKHRNVLAVTHGGVIKCALCLVFENFDYFYKFRIDNASITVVTIEQGFKYIKALNVKEDLTDILNT